MNGLLGTCRSCSRSASSPFWRGEPTARVEPADGLRGVPASGPPPRQGLRRLRGGRRPARAHRLHRRLHAHLVGHPTAPAPGTIRCASATRSRGEDVVAIAAFFQAIVKMYCDEHAPAARSQLAPDAATENKWWPHATARAPVMDLATGRRNRVPIAQPAPDAAEIEPHARELGSSASSRACARSARGNGSDRQLRVWTRIASSGRARCAGHRQSTAALQAYGCSDDPRASQGGCRPANASAAAVRFRCTTFLVFGVITYNQASATASRSPCGETAATGADGESTCHSGLNAMPSAPRRLRRRCRRRDRNGADRPQRPTVWRELQRVARAVVKCRCPAGRCNARSRGARRAGAPSRRRSGRRRA